VYPLIGRPKIGVFSLFSEEVTGVEVISRGLSSPLEEAASLSDEITNMGAESLFKI
jgi:hypothetical protein